MFRFFENLINPFPDKGLSTPPSGLFAFVMHYSRPALPWVLVMAVLTAVISMIDLLLLGYVGHLVDWLGSADRETFLADYGWKLGGMLLLAAFLPAVVLLNSLMANQVLFGNYPGMMLHLMHRYILGQSMAFFQDEFAGRISQKVLQTARATRETVMKLAEVFVYVSVFFFGGVILVGRMDIWLIAPFMIWFSLYVVILVYFLPKLRALSKENAAARAMLTGHVVDSYTNIQTIKLFAHTVREEAHARDVLESFIETMRRQMRRITGLTVSLHCCNALLLIAIVVVSVYSWMQASISLGSIAVAAALALRVKGMSNYVLWQLANLFENIGTVQDGINTIAKPVTVMDKPGAGELTVDQGGIQFDHVRFHYGREAGVIEDFSLTIRPGEKIGVVGRSGAGKSTLVNLLLRFHDLESGRILIDGQDIADVSQASLRRYIGMVTQDTSLLHRSIRDNIGYGRPEAEDNEILQAAQWAQADDFIPDLSDIKGRTGYDAHVGERGVKLSGGQRQRIAIARVLLKDAPILVLDEATSALDSDVENAIQDQLAKLMEGKTVIAIAHRLSTIAMLDRLVVIDKGRVIETGSHDELLQQNGLYASLWQRQSGGFLGLDTDTRDAAAD